MAASRHSTAVSHADELMSTEEREIVANLDPSLDQDAPGVLHWQTKKPSVAREEYGGSGVGSTSKGKAGRCYKCQQLGHWASDCPN